MLLEKSQQLIELSKQRINLQKAADSLDTLKTRNKQINQAIKDLDEDVKALRLFRERGMIAFDFSPSVSELLNFIDTILSQYQEDSEWILNNKNFRGEFLKLNINKIKTTLEKQLLQAWKNYLNREMPSSNPELLNLLSQVEAFKSTVQKIRQLDSQIQRDQFPKYQEELDHTNNLIQQLKNTWDTLNAENVPDEVLKFLKAAASSTGASLDLLTPTVQIWVKDHHLSNTLRIRLS